MSLDRGRAEPLCAVAAGRTGAGLGPGGARRGALLRGALGPRRGSPRSARDRPGRSPRQPPSAARRSPWPARRCSRRWSRRASAGPRKRPRTALAASSSASASDAVAPGPRHTDGRNPARPALSPLGHPRLHGPDRGGRPAGELPNPEHLANLAREIELAERLVGRREAGAARAPRPPRRGRPLPPPRRPTSSRSSAPWRRRTACSRAERSADRVHRRAAAAAGRRRSCRAAARLPQRPRQRDQVHGRTGARSASARARPGRRPSSSSRTRASA